MGLGAAGQLQLLDQVRAGRPQHQLATLAAGPRRRPGQNVNPGRVDQDHAAQVQHDVVVALANEVAEVLPELGRGGTTGPRLPAVNPSCVYVSPGQPMDKFEKDADIAAANANFEDISNLIMRARGEAPNGGE